jgi:peptidoglycan DL-endopeptidase CwlO
MGTAVSRSQLQPGDLIAFYSPVSHIGIYIGNGQMVHAPTSGDVVKVASIDVMGSITAMRRLG